jgi:SOS response regulatory protein OraA/RecX
MSKNDKIKFENSANLAYDRALKYLTERFDFEKSVFKKFKRTM